MKNVLASAAQYEVMYGIVARGHYLAADHHAALNRYFGIPVIVITAIVGTTIFGTLNENPDPFWRITTGLVALVGTVLSSLQTSLGFAQAAEKHKTAGEVYRGFTRSFRIFRLKYAEAKPGDRQAAFAELKEIVDGLANLAREFPTLPDRFYDKAKIYDKAKKEHALAKRQGSQTGRNSGFFSWIRIGR
jgi:hypothetical protein